MTKTKNLNTYFYLCVFWYRCLFLIFLTLLERNAKKKDEKLQCGKEHLCSLKILIFKITEYWSDWEIIKRNRFQIIIRICELAMKPVSIFK